MVPNALTSIVAFISHLRLEGIPCSIRVFRRLFTPKVDKEGFVSLCSAKMKTVGLANKVRNWQSRFVFVHNRERWSVPTRPRWVDYDHVKKIRLTNEENKLFFLLKDREVNIWDYLSPYEIFRNLYAVVGFAFPVDPNIVEFMSSTPPCSAEGGEDGCAADEFVLDEAGNLIVPPISSRHPGLGEHQLPVDRPVDPPVNSPANPATNMPVNPPTNLPPTGACTASPTQVQPTSPSEKRQKKVIVGPLAAKGKGVADAQGQEDVASYSDSFPHDSVAEQRRIGSPFFNTNLKAPTWHAFNMGSSVSCPKFQVDFDNFEGSKLPYAVMTAQALGWQLAYTLCANYKIQRQELLKSHTKVADMQKALKEEKQAQHKV